MAHTHPQKRRPWPSPREYVDMRLLLHHGYHQNGELESLGDGVIKQRQSEKVKLWGFCSPGWLGVAKRVESGHSSVDTKICDGVGDYFHSFVAFLRLLLCWPHRHLAMVLNAPRSPCALGL